MVMEPERLGFATLHLYMAPENGANIMTTQL